MVPAASSVAREPVNRMVVRTPMVEARADGIRPRLQEADPLRQVLGRWVDELARDREEDRQALHAATVLCRR